MPEDDGPSDQGQAEVHEKGSFSTIGPEFTYRIENHHWYSARVRVRGEHMECFLGKAENQVKVSDFMSELYPNGRIGLRCVHSAYRFKNIKVTSPDGKLLWQGLPALPAE